MHLYNYNQPIVLEIGCIAAFVDFLKKAHKIHKSFIKDLSAIGYFSKEYLILVSCRQKKKKKPQKKNNKKKKNDIYIKFCDAFDLANPMTPSLQEKDSTDFFQGEKKTTHIHTKLTRTNPPKGAPNVTLT